jgi:hypothetical protein
VEFWNGSEWVSAGTDLNVITNQTIDPDGLTATFTLDEATTAESILVTINGLNQTPVVDYTVTGNSITFTTTPIESDTVQIRYIATTSTVTAIVNANSYVQIDGASSNVNITVNGTLSAEFANTGVYVTDLYSSGRIQLPVYNVSSASALTGNAAGQLIYVSNGDSGSPCLAVYSGGTWKRVALGATIST